MKKSLCALLGALALGAVPAWAENIVFPSDAGVINVTDAAYGANGSDSVDDTAALQEAISAGISAAKIVYIPNGTYIVSNTLDGKETNGEWKGYMMIQGQSRAGTILKLPNSAAGYTSTGTPKAMIRTATDNASGSNGDGNHQAFNNDLRNLTVDTGSGNVGAIAVDYLVNNRGAIRDVTIKSSDSTKRGICGISMKRDGPGPGLIKNVSITGFDYGMDITRFERGMTVEHLNLSGQKVAGIRNTVNIFSIRDLQSQNSVPVYTATDSRSLLTLVDANCTGGSGAFAFSATGGKLLRNVSTSGYASAIGGQTGTDVTEYSSLTKELFTSSQKTLNLPVQETPDNFDSNLSNWRSVGAPSSDNTAAIQAALDSGKSTVYFPKGSFKIKDTLTVPSSVRHIIGMESSMDLASGHFFNDASSPRPVFKFVGSNSCVIERLRFDYSFRDSAPGSIAFEQSGSGALALVDMRVYAGVQLYRATSGAGDLFIEDLTTHTPFVFDQPQNIWARQFNTEVDRDPMIWNSAANLWILGIKTEQPRTVLRATGGQTEILGGCIYPTETATVPTFEIVNAAVSLSLVATGNAGYSVAVRETQDGITRDLLRSALPGRGTAGYLLPLYVSGVPSPGGVTGASVWLKADAGVSKDGSDLVSLWDDQTSNHADATQSTSTAKPLFVAAQLNGLPILRFDGNSDFLNLPNGFADFTAGLTAFIVAKPTSNASGARFFEFSTSSSGNNRIIIARNSSTNTLAYRTNSGGSPNFADALPVNEAHFWTLRHAAGAAGASTTAEVWKSGDSLGTGNAPIPPNITRTLNRIAVASNGSNKFKGDLAEFILFPRALSTTERQDVENYLQSKWFPSGALTEQSPAKTLAPSAGDS